MFTGTPTPNNYALFYEEDAVSFTKGKCVDIDNQIYSCNIVNVEEHDVDGILFFVIPVMFVFLWFMFKCKWLMKFLDIFKL